MSDKFEMVIETHEFEGVPRDRLAEVLTEYLDSHQKEVREFYEGWIKEDDAGCDTCGLESHPDTPHERRPDGVMDMSYDQLAREPLFSDRDDDWNEE
jgi:hypothetical protein